MPELDEHEGRTKARDGFYRGFAGARFDGDAPRIPETHPEIGRGVERIGENQSDGLSQAKIAHPVLGSWRRPV